MRTALSVRSAILFVGTALVLMAAPQVSAAELQCGELVRQKCQGCHSLGRICAQLGRDKGEWQESVAAMADYDPSISIEDQKTVVKCLSQQDKNVVAFCR